MKPQIISNDKVKIYFIDNRADKSSPIELLDVLFTKYKEIILHREDGPAIEYATGSQYWYQNGVAHREDGPAHIHKYKNGNMATSYYLRGKKIICDSDNEFIKIVKFPAFL